MPAIDNSYLVGLFGGSSSSANNLLTSIVTGSTTQATAPVSSSASSTPRAPSAPWRKTEVADSALVSAALNGKTFIDENAATLDVKGASDDYRKLFAMYQGLNTLEALATRMGAKGVGAFEKSQIQRVFDKGLAQVQAYAETVKLDNVRLTAGSAMSRAQSLAGVKRSDTVYETGIVHSGDSGAEVAAFQGAVKFDMQVKAVNTTTTVSMDLSEMTQPRTMANVISYMNGKLALAGVKTRFASERVPGVASTITAGGKTITLPAKADSWRLNVKGDLGETLTFSAPAASEAVYVAQVAGKPAYDTVTSGVTKTTASTLNSQLLKFQTDTVATAETPPDVVAMPDDKNWVDGRVFANGLGDGVGTVHASVTGPDGSVYVVADATGSVSTQAIKGDQDAVLIKYDSAGNTVWTRTLGAAQTASGYSLAVAADGKIAIAGSVTGALEAGDDGLDPKKSDSYVTLFDASGQEMWSQRRAARLEDEATAVAFGDDGTVYVAGRARSTMPGATGSVGGWDSYVQAFETVAGPTSYAVSSGSAQTLEKTATYKGQAKFTLQFGTTDSDKPAGLVVNGSSLYVAGVEGADAVLRKYDLQATGAPTLAATRDLGAIGGSIAGIAIDGGNVIVAGTTTNGALSAGTVTHDYSGGGSDAFAARLSLDLAPDANDRLAYYGGSGTDTATAVAVSNGKVWIAGSSNAELPDLTVQGAGTKPVDGYLARLDLDTGLAEWSRRFTSTDQKVAPTSIAVDATGASALDRLGLPKGTIQFKDSKLITASTSLRAGDQFYIRTDEGGAKKAVTISATDTLQTLAAKVRRAAGFAAKVDVQKMGDYDTLKITPLNNRASIEILAGKVGKDALAALGLNEGVVSNAALAASDSDIERVYGLGITENLSLADSAKTATALKFIQSAISTVKNAYNYISNPDLFKTGDGTKKTSSSNQSTTAPAYLTNQIANYQAALSRLTGQ